MSREIKVMLLKELAERIYIGAPQYSVSRLQSADDGIPLINIKDISEGVVEKEKLKRFNIESFKNCRNYLVHPGNVIIACRGTQLKNAIIPAGIGEALISSNIIAIKSGKTLNPEFLSAYLKTRDGQRELMKSVASSTMQFALNVKDIGEIQIPVIPPDLQKKIVELINTIEKQYKISIQIASLSREMGNRIIMDMLERH